MAAASYDPNFEFNAPKFHDFTNPNQDDDADDFFDTCDHESLPTGEMSMKHVTDQQHNDQVDVGESCHLSSAEMQVADADNIRADQPATENALLVEDLRLGKENSSIQNGVAEGAAASQCGTKSASKTASSSTKTNTKLTESIMALATFKGKEAEMSHIAQSTVATAASMSSPSNEEAPVSARTRSSLELEGQRKSQDDTCAQASALKAAASPTIALRTSHSANKGQASEEKKRGHKTEKTESGGASTTPCKSLAKKPRTEQPVSKTPNFSRFDASRGRTTAISRTPSGRASSASAADRPAKTPRSAAKLMHGSQEHGSRSSLRPSSSSSNTARSTATPRLTVPVSPKLTSESRTRKRLVQGESSVASDADRSLSSSQLRRLSTSSAQSSQRSVAGSARKLTVPKSPNLRSVSRSRQSSAMRSTEEAQMLQALEAVENLKKRRKLGEERLKHLLEPKSAATPALSTKTLVVPQSPNLSARSRQAASAGGEGDLPFAEAMSKMERAGGGRSKTPVPTRHGPPTLTQPKTPNFSSFRRTAPKVQSRAEREEAALKSAKRNQFKARPLNRLVLDSCGDLGVPKVTRKALTLPHSPQLSTSMRSGRSRSSSMDSLSSLSSSSLNSWGVSSLNGPARAARADSARSRQRPTTAPTSSLPQSNAKSVKKLTNPVSPKLTSHLRHRSTSVSASSSEEELSRSFKALDMPDLSRPFVPKHNAAKLTEPSGFKLMTEERHAARHAELKARQEADEKAAEEARCFKANPVRSSHLASLGVHTVSKRPVTEAKPFALMSEAKHAVASMQWASRVERELEEEKGKFASFQAKPVPAVVADGSKVYTPRRSSKPLTEVQNIELNVDRRMQKHQEISAHKAERERALEAEKLAQQLRRKEQEEREVRQLRRSMVVKAKPVPLSVYNGAAPQVHSSKPLTEPMSPVFRTDMRLRSTRT